MKKDWSQYQAVALLPLIAVVILFATYVSARNSFFFCNDQSCTESIPANIWKVFSVETTGDATPPSDPKQIAAEKVARENKDRETVALRYAGRMNWYFIAMLYLFLCVGALAIAAIISYQVSDRRKVVMTFLVLLIPIILGVYLYTHESLHMPMFLAIFEKTITADVPGIVRTTNFLDSFSNAAAFALLLTSCSLLLPIRKNTFPDGMEELSKRMKYLRTLLYAGTLLLILTIVLKKTIFQWSLAYTSQEAQALKTAGNFVASFLAGEGGFYTLVLIAVYVPAAIVLQRRANLLRDLPVEDEEREKEIAAYGLTFSLKESLPRLLAILGPVLVGPIGEILNRAF